MLTLNEIEKFMRLLGKVEFKQANKLMIWVNEVQSRLQQEQTPKEDGPQNNGKQ